MTVVNVNTSLEVAAETVAELSGVLGQIASFPRKLAAKNESLFAEARLALVEDWSVEARQALARLYEYYGFKFADFDQRLDEMEQSAELSRIVHNFEYEAMRDAIYERRRMLAHATAGLVDPTLTVERKARVERTLRLLDPEDILTLWGLSRIPGPPKASNTDWLQELPAGDVLLSCGCVRLDLGEGGFGRTPKHIPMITRLGHDVLRALRSYVTTRTLPFEVPGREVLLGDQPEGDARNTLNAIPRLYEFGTMIRGLGHMLGYVRERGPTEGRFIRVFVHEHERILDSLDALVLATKGAAVEVQKHWQPYTAEHGAAPIQLLRIEVHGPHDLLRHLADDWEAYWDE